MPAKMRHALSAYRLKNLGLTAEYMTVLTAGQYISDAVQPALNFYCSLVLPFSYRALIDSLGSKKPDVKRSVN